MVISFSKKILQEGVFYYVWNEFITFSEKHLLEFSKEYFPMFEKVLCHSLRKILKDRLFPYVLNKVKSFSKKTF